MCISAYVHLKYVHLNIYLWSKKNKKTFKSTCACILHRKLRDSSSMYQSERPTRKKSDIVADTEHLLEQSYLGVINICALDFRRKLHHVTK